MIYMGYNDGSFSLTPIVDDQNTSNNVGIDGDRHQMAGDVNGD